jgi:hypothetical protein
MNVQPVYDKGPHPLSRTGTQAARGKTSAISYRLNNCVTFIVNNLQTRPRVAQYNLADRGLETHGLGAATRSGAEMTPHNAITGILYQLSRAGRNSSSFFLHVVHRGSSWFYSAYWANYLYTKVATKSSFEWPCRDAADEAYHQQVNTASSAME